jgi:hypothetical protein
MALVGVGVLKCRDPAFPICYMAETHREPCYIQPGGFNRTTVKIDMVAFSNYLKLPFMIELSYITLSHLPGQNLSIPSYSPLQIMSLGQG